MAIGKVLKVLAADFGHFRWFNRELELFQSKFDFHRQFSAQSILDISLSVRRQFAPVSKEALNQQMLRDISRDISQRYAIKKYGGNHSDNRCCVLMNRDLHHVHVYWRDEEMARNYETAQWVIKVSSHFDNKQQPLEYFYRPSSQQLQNQQMTIVLPSQAIQASHRVSVGRFDHENQFQPRLESNSSSLNIKRLVIAEPFEKAVSSQSASGLS